MRAKFCDKYAFTRHRWLLNDEWNRNSRYIDFNFEVLKKKVVLAVPGSTEVVKWKKREGAFSRAFIMSTDNKKTVLAKLPSSCAGPSSLLTHSEVATMAYIKDHTSVPIPEVLSWSDFPDNDVGSEYIIMEYDTGIPLQLRWSTMDVDEKLRLIDGLYEILDKLLRLRFPFYGSLYFEHWPLPRTSVSRQMGGGYRIGPHCGNRYWGLTNPEPRYYSRTVPNRGPWLSFQEYCDGLVDTGISHVPMTEAYAPPKPWYHGTVGEHLDVLEIAREVMQIIPIPSEIRRATLVHPDLHLGNILVARNDPTFITAIIDWQAVSIEPAFMQIPKLPFLRPNENDSDSRACADRSKHELRYSFPKLYEALNLDRDLYKLYHYCPRIWVDGAAIYQATLNRVASRWEELNLPSDLERSPFPELSEMDKTYINWNNWGLREGMALKTAVANFLGTRVGDGIIFPGDYEAKVYQNQRLFEEFLHYVLWKQANGMPDAFSNEYQLRLAWPFDL